MGLMFRMAIALIFLQLPTKEELIHGIYEINFVSKRNMC